MPLILVSLLSAAGGAFLDDPDLLNTLQTSKATSISIQESLVVTEQTEREIDLAREAYRPCSRRASILFFVLNDMSVIDPMYQFSLDAYNALFMLSIDKSPKRLKLHDRIDSLNDYHTYAVYRCDLERRAGRDGEFVKIYQSLQEFIFVAVSFDIVGFY